MISYSLCRVYHSGYINCYPARDPDHRKPSGIWHMFVQRWPFSAPLSKLAKQADNSWQDKVSSYTQDSFARTLAGKQHMQDYMQAVRMLHGNAFGTLVDEGGRVQDLPSKSFWSEILAKTPGWFETFLEKSPQTFSVCVLRSLKLQLQQRSPAGKKLLQLIRKIERDGPVLLPTLAK
ncbi:unnamed protein product [Polarella glacialis]|uniref:Uncharacterized protein n=1 Tax=Polarella glacialis TaxID=89957 RepID=A0A813GUR9_POLGL|nr:unnamed protein product [Polarella glacialis]